MRRDAPEETTAFDRALERLTPVRGNDAGERIVANAGRSPAFRFTRKPPGISRPEVRARWVRNRRLPAGGKGLGGGAARAASPAGVPRPSMCGGCAVLPLPLPSERIGGADRLRHHARLHHEWLIVDRLAFRRAARRDAIQHLVRHFREPDRGQGGGKPHFGGEIQTSSSSAWAFFSRINWTST